MLVLAGHRDNTVLCNKGQVTKLVPSVSDMMNSIGLEKGFDKSIVCQYSPKSTKSKTMTKVTKKGAFYQGSCFSIKQVTLTIISWLLAKALTNMITKFFKFAKHHMLPLHPLPYPTLIFLPSDASCFNKDSLDWTLCLNFFIVVCIVCLLMEDCGTLQGSSSRNWSPPILWAHK